MRDLFITLYALFFLWFLGLNFMIATKLRNSSARTLASIATDFSIGAGLLYLILFSASLIADNLMPYLVYLVLAILVPLNLFNKNLKFNKVWLADPKEAAGLLLIIVLLFILFLPSLHKGLEWDAWAIWAFKAKAFYADGKISSLFLSDIDRYGYSHPDYPLLVPIVKYWIYFHLGHINDHVIRLVTLAFWIAMLGYFYSTLSDHIKMPIALLSMALLSFTWPLTTNVLMSSADTIQAFYNLLGMVYLYQWIERGDRNSLWTGVIILSAGINVKNEGLAFWLSAAGALLVISSFRFLNKREIKTLYPLAGFLLTGILFSGLWIIVKKYAGIGSELFSKGIPAMDTIIGRSGEIVIYYLGQIININYPGWGLIWVFLILALLKIIVCGDLKRESFQFCLFTCFSHMLILFAIYCISPYDLDYHMQTSGDRTLLQLVPSLFWISVLSLLSEQKNNEAISPSKVSSV